MTALRVKDPSTTLTLRATPPSRDTNTDAASSICPVASSSRLIDEPLYLRLRVVCSWFALALTVVDVMVDGAVLSPRRLLGWARELEYSGFLDADFLDFLPTLWRIQGLSSRPRSSSPRVSVRKKYCRFLILPTSSLPCPLNRFLKISNENATK